jgi:hypothetical protein
VRKCPKQVVLIIAMIAIATASAHAADAPIFPKDSFTLHAAAGYVRSLDKDEADIGALELGANYYLWDNLSLGVELNGFEISQLGEDASAISLEATFRHHFWQPDDRWTTYIDGAFGPSYSTRDTPQGGTHFNFISRIGLGATVRLDEHVHLMFGARYWHLSNARIEGTDRNPNFNGAQVYVGLMWQF